MGGESKGNAQGKDFKLKPKRTQIKRVVPESREFKAGREAAALKTRIRETAFTPSQADNLREFMKLKDEYDAAQQVANKFVKVKNDGEREAATARQDAAKREMKELSELIAENRKTLLSSGLNVDKLGLETQENRKIFAREHAESLKSLDVAGKKAVAERNKQQAATTKEYLAGIDKVNDVHNDLVANKRELTIAIANKDVVQIDKLKKIDEAIRKAYAEGRADLKKSETAAIAAGVDVLSKAFATKAGREELYKKSPQLRSEKSANGRIPEHKRMVLNRKEELDAPVIVGEDTDEVPFLGHLPGPDDVKGDASRNFIKVTDADYDNVGKRETAIAPEPQPAPEQPEEDLKDDLVDDDEASPIPAPLKPVLRGSSGRVIRNEPPRHVTDVIPPQPPAPSTAWDRAKNWVASTPVGRTAKWIGAGIVFVLGMNIVGPRENVEAPPAQDKAAASAERPATNIEFDHANVEISSPTEPAGDWGGTELQPGPEQLVVSVPDNGAPEAPPVTSVAKTIKKGRTASNSDDRMTLEELLPRLDAAAETMRDDSDRMDSQLRKLGYDSAGLRAGALRYDLKTWAAGNKFIKEFANTDLGSASPETVDAVVKIATESKLPGDKAVRSMDSAERMELLKGVVERNEALKALSTAGNFDAILATVKRVDLQKKIDENQRLIDAVNVLDTFENLQ